MTSFLLDSGADPNVLSQHHETPLHLALRKHVRGSNCPDAWSHSHARLELIFGFIDGDDEDIDETRSEVFGIRQEVIDKLLSHKGIDLAIQDIEGSTSLHAAPYGDSRCWSIVRSLLKKGADVSTRDAKNRNALHLACKAGDMRSTMALLIYGAEIASQDDDGLIALHSAARNLSPRTMSSVLCVSKPQCHTLIISKDKEGRNALHHALSRVEGVENTLQLLLDRSIDVNSHEKSGNSPLSTYLGSFRLVYDDCCRLLLRSGAEPRYLNDKGMNLVHLSAYGSQLHVEILELLMNYGVDLTALDNHGRTVLHHAGIRGSLTAESLEFLLSRSSIDVSLVDSSGKTALQHATEEADQCRDPNVFDAGRWTRTRNLLKKSSSMIQRAPSSSDEAG